MVKSLFDQSQEPVAHPYWLDIFSISDPALTWRLRLWHVDEAVAAHALINLAAQLGHAAPHRQQGNPDGAEEGAEDSAAAAAAALGESSSFVSSSYASAAEGESSYLSSSYSAVSTGGRGGGGGEEQRRPAAAAAATSYPPGFRGVTLTLKQSEAVG